MEILIAPDKFKDALTAPEVCKALEKGILEALPQASCKLLPLADGGEGTALLLTKYAKGSNYTAKVHDPLLHLIDASWGYNGLKKQAFIELAEASGLRLLTPDDRNPLNTTTYGTGELIALALEKGAREITLGLGGSATHDGGTGMAAALGYRFYGASGKLIPRPCGRDLPHIKHINTDQVNPLFRNCRVMAACDVDNPLTGPNGAAYTFAAQKGAVDDELPYLEDGLRKLAELIKTALGVAVEDIPASGAAGGAGAGVLAFLHGRLENGARLILSQSGFSKKLQEAELLITGEGKLDASSLQGKLLSSLCREAKEQRKKVIVFCGSSSLNPEELEKAKQGGIHAIIPISSEQESLEEALKNTRLNLQQAATKYFSTEDFS